MPRSVKKGPFVQPRLLERIHAMNEAGYQVEPGRRRVGKR